MPIMKLVMSGVCGADHVSLEGKTDSHLGIHIEQVLRNTAEGSVCLFLHTPFGKGSDCVAVPLVRHSPCTHLLRFISENRVILACGWGFS